ncbi:hypothetical protein G6011_09117 [Alternaria panax]|uniref:Uncharacterized protein n=1 Tax=Alternaria panax TaxID=48097 RepID=A0AAD4IAG0_9PLEO|nr:hypothetical protein G6011_09117 [Alternaria panax]
MPAFPLCKVFRTNDAGSPQIQRQPPMLAVTEPKGSQQTPKRKHSVYDEQNKNSPVSFKKMCQPESPATPAMRPSILLSNKPVSPPKHNEALDTPSKHAIQHPPSSFTESPAASSKPLEDYGLRLPPPRKAGPTPSEKFAILPEKVARST